MNGQPRPDGNNKTWIIAASSSVSLLTAAVKHENEHSAEVLTKNMDITSMK